MTIDDHERIECCSVCVNGGRAQRAGRGWLVVCRIRGQEVEVGG